MDVAADILVVDDDPDIRATVVEVLRDEGYDVTSAANGREALRHLSELVARAELGDERAHLPRLILLDLMMPVMNGEQFQEVKLGTPALVNIPVVILSASVNVAEAALLGANGVLGKPVSLDELLVVVQKYGGDPRAK